MNNSNPATELAIIRAHTASGEARRVRINARLSLSEVATQCGTDPGTVSRWEAAQRRPRGESGLKYGRLIAQLAELDLGNGVKA